MISGYRQCPDCGGELVDVDNPFRREVRHRRGSPPCTPLTPEQRAKRDESEARLASLLRQATPVETLGDIEWDLTSHFTSPCPHETFTAEVAVNRLTDGGGPVTSFMADVRLSCAECGEPFRFVGVPFGVSPGQPCVSVDGRELRLPVLPAGASTEGSREP